ncbi:hypothetical protein [Mesorhizobium sp. M0859]|uniref:hypothetical protein n=1 Tax=Mesorhizobium sp. M0859 TaxID=2957014 RepID=UPI00333A1E1C
MCARHAAGDQEELLAIKKSGRELPERNIIFSLRGHMDAEEAEADWGKSSGPDRQNLFPQDTT